MRYQKSFKDICTKILKLGKFEVDYYDMFDHTLVHEMTHCITSKKIGETYDTLRTSDGGLEDDGYGWESIHRARNTKYGPLNADSYAFMALAISTLSDDNNEAQIITHHAGSWMLRRQQTKIKSNGCLEHMPTYQKDSQLIYVDDQWRGSVQKRSITTSLRDLYQRAPDVPTISLAALQSSNATNRTSTQASITHSDGSRWSLSTSISSSSSTALAMSTHTSNSTHVSNSTYTWHLPTSFIDSTGIVSSVTTVFETSRFASSPVGNRTEIPGSTGGESLENSTPVFASSTTSQTGLSGMPSSSTQSTGIQTTKPTAPSSTLNQTSWKPTITNVPPLPSSFFYQTPVATPTSSALLCPLFTSCSKPTPSWLETIVSVRDIYIPKITDLSAVSTQRVKQNEGDDDSTAVVFAKVELPKDKCDLVPKPKSGGLIGAVLDVANKMIDTVVDAACNVEFPVIEGNLPDWMDFTRFPGLKGYSASSGPGPNEPSEPSPSRAVSSAASEETPSSSSSSSSCSATAIARCKATNIISGTVTRSFITECSTQTACSGTGTTSTYGSTIATPSGTMFPHPEVSDDWSEEQDCFFSLMDTTQRELNDTALADCLGEPLTISMTTTSTSSFESSPSSSFSSSTKSTPVSQSSSQSGGTSTGSGALTATRTNLPPTSTNSSQTDNWDCTDSMGDRDDKQCSCEPVDCTGDSCTAVVMKKGEDGCSDTCEGCDIASFLSRRV
ncbi:hypothetical protein CC80DRAFT_123650 [Byssothecium circinans]|uniref:Uncharacterized protein n=1 Tax=Byssothecium circinans TaxID=147558 RepID=A0A6A5TQW7_9PLEO|nr:hypothetical protein CC80DRAFT_123650 [Byssothecium circinans]